MFCVRGLCLPFSSLRQWAVDVFEVVQRPSSVPLQIHGCLSEPFTPVSRCLSPPSTRTSCPRTGGCWRLSAWFGLCLSKCFFLSLLLSMSVHRVFHPVRRSVVFLHAVWLRVVLPWRDNVLDCSGCNRRPVCPRLVLLLCADC